MIDTVIEHSNSLDDFVNRMDLDYGVKIRVTNATISYQTTEMKKPIRGKRLGDEYDKARLEERILASYSKRRTADSKALTSSLEMLLSKLNEVSERNDRQLVEITERMDVLETPADSFVTEELAPTAIEATKESELQLSEVRKVGSWDEELKKFCKNNPGMDVDEVLDKFPEYYDRMMREAQKTEEERSIVTRGR